MIAIRNLKKSFGDFTAVSGLNLEIPDQGVFGLLGPNGAGKTTTISMICGLLPPTSGTIEFTGFKGRDKKSLIGYCPQENIFYPKLSCLEQLVFMGCMFGMREKQAIKKSHELLESLGLKDKTKVLAGKLSGGMKRRLNIALAMIHDPEVVIFDEPEAGLDPQSRILVREFIKSFGSSKTVILTTHNMDEADRMASQIAIMDHGKLLMLGTPENLKKTVGEGDILEIIPENTNNEEIEKLAALFSEKGFAVTPQMQGILIKHPDIIAHLADIKVFCDQQHFMVSEFKLRENSLEDVFIHLTGRNLRA